MSSCWFAGAGERLRVGKALVLRAAPLGIVVTSPDALGGACRVTVSGLDSCYAAGTANVAGNTGYASVRIDGNSLANRLIRSFAGACRTEPYTVRVSTFFTGNIHISSGNTFRHVVPSELAGANVAACLFSSR